jgi:cell division topological specificity factor
MLDLLKWALQRHERSKDAARQRLKVILVIDRIGITAEHMETMKKDIIEVVSKYLVVDEESIEMDMRRSEDSMVLVSNIQIKDVVRSFSAS